MLLLLLLLRRPKRFESELSILPACPSDRLTMGSILSTISVVTMGYSDPSRWSALTLSVAFNQICESWARNPQASEREKDRVVKVQKKQGEEDSKNDADGNDQRRADGVHSRRRRTCRLSTHACPSVSLLLANGGPL